MICVLLSGLRFVICCDYVGLGGNVIACFVCGLRCDGVWCGVVCFVCLCVLCVCV